MAKVLKGSYLDIATQLSLKENDVLFIASDIKQLALNARAKGDSFDVNAFIESFQELLPKGTLVIPAYTDLLKPGDVFDHKKAKPTTGALSNKVMRRKDFVRSKDPLHSVFAWGKYSQEIKNMDGPSTLGKGSVFDLLFENSAKMICIDVDFQNSFTFVHYIEEKMEVNYRKAYHWSIDRLIDGVKDSKSFIFHTKRPGVLTDLEDLQKRSVEDGVNDVFQFENSTIQFFDLGEMHAYVENYVQNGGKLYRRSAMFLAKSIAKKILKKD